MRMMKMVMAAEGEKGSTISEATARETTANAVDVVVQLRRTEYQIDGVTRSLRRCVSIVEVQKTGSSFEDNFHVKIVPVFQTEIDPGSGKPFLNYIPGRSKLWDALGKLYKSDAVPGWAKADVPIKLDDV